MTRYPLVAAVLVSLSLAACTNPLARFAPGEAEVVRAGWYEPAPRPPRAPRTCYRTLARVDCHSAPLAGEEPRRVGWFDGPVTD